MIPLWLKGVMAFSALALVAFAGWQVNEWRAGSIRATALALALEQEKEKLFIEQEERGRVDVLRAEADAKVLDFQERERIRTDELKALIASVVPDNSDCDLGDGAIGLLNDARGYRKKLSGPTKHVGNVPESVAGDTGQALNAP